jgi:hypothetical protein
MNPQAAPHLETSPYFFNPRELARLAVYRAAIIARFYTDQCEPIPVRANIEAVGLLESVRREHRAAA